MLKRRRRNLVADLCQCFRYWRELRRYPGVFSARDAMRNMSAIALPRRFSHRAAGRSLASEARIERIEGEAHEVTLLKNGLAFYWLGAVDNNLHYVIAQEFDPDFPHYYTTPPVALTAESLVLDVGACEGLFAFRLLKQGEARRVICFEPSARTAQYLKLGAEKNGVGSRMAVENLAVARASGRVRFSDTGSPEGNRVLGSADGEGGAAVECVSLDDYCATRNLTLNRRDLIKVDAEGSDFDVLLGAEHVIRQGSPQVAITTYHHERHVFEMLDWLRGVQPAYRLRVKGFASWTPKPVPVLLQAAR